jgi:hypothetical protein
MNAVLWRSPPYAVTHICIESHVKCSPQNYSQWIFSPDSSMAMFNAHRILIPSSCDTLTTVLLELPISIVERANLTCLQPTGDAVEMESML